MIQHFSNIHPVVEIQKHFEEIIKMVKAGSLDLKHLFLNADAGFEDSKFRQYLERTFIEANIGFNKRNGSKTDRYEYFDEVLYQERFACFELPIYLGGWTHIKSFLFVMKN